MNSKKRSAEESLLNEGFCEDFSTPTKKQRIGDQSLELSASKKKKAYTIEFKLEIIEEANKSSISAIAKKYSIDRKCIRRWIHTEDELKNLSKSQK